MISIWRFGFLFGFIGAGIMSATAAPVDLRTLRLEDIRCSIGVSKMGCTTIILNCRSRFFRCNGGGSGSGNGSNGGGPTGTIEMTISTGSDKQCTTNVPGKSCQDLIDIVTSGDKGPKIPGDGGSSGSSTPTTSIPVAITMPSTVPINYYKINSTSYKSVKKALTSTIKDSKGNYVWALSTLHNIKPGELKYKPVQKGGKYYIGSVSGAIKYDIKMPKWIKIKSAKPCLQAAWNEMYPKLLKHEEGHIAYFRMFEDFLKDELANIPPASKKEDLTELFNMAIQRALNKVFELNKKFEDDNTDSEGNIIGLSFNPC